MHQIACVLSFLGDDTPELPLSAVIHDWEPRINSLLGGSRISSYATGNILYINQVIVHGATFQTCADRPLICFRQVKGHPSPLGLSLVVRVLSVVTLCLPFPLRYCTNNWSLTSYCTRAIKRWSISSKSVATRCPCQRVSFLRSNCGLNSTATFVMHWLLNFVRLRTSWEFCADLQNVDCQTNFHLYCWSSYEM